MTIQQAEVDGCHLKVEEKEMKTDDKIKLTDAQLYKEDGEYYLHLKYSKENLEGVYEIDIPKVALNIRQDDIRISTILVEDCAFGYYGKGMHTIDLCRNSVFEICDNKEGYRIKESLIREKKRKMTVSEIEKALGYKVEIVSKK